MNINFTGGVLPYKKHRYQEGNESDCELKCSDGSVMVREYWLATSTAIYGIFVGQTSPTGLFFALALFFERT